MNGIQNNYGMNSREVSYFPKEDEGDIDEQSLVKKVIAKKFPEMRSAGIHIQVT